MRLVDGEIRYSASDLSNFLACRHLSRLEQAAAHGRVSKPHHEDLGFTNLVERGQEHEKRVLREFRDRGWTVQEITSAFYDREKALAETEAALESGVDVIYQAALVVGDRLGYPDFLVQGHLLGSGEGYEVVDAKLARSAKARAVLQATFYSRLLGEKTGIQPKRMYLALGNQEMAHFDVSAYAAYERQVDAMFRTFAEGDAVFPVEEPYPDPVEHCAICRWQPMCRARRRDDDDLSLIAGITSNQRKALKLEGIETRRAFAARDELPPLDRVGRESLQKVQLQARIQVEGEDAGENRWELIDPEERDGELVADRGLLILPEPAQGDLFFDIEGARFYSEDGKEFGLQYLFGVVNTAERDDEGRPAFRSFWAFDRAGERQAFEELMDFFAEHLDRYPDAHVYHYNHYEPTAVEHLSDLHVTREDVLRRLMGRFATREDQVDDLLRRRIFVDLYRAVRQGVRASVESYSIKRLEPFFDFDREVELKDVNEQMVLFDMALDAGTASDDLGAQRLIQGYNEDDCRATLALRDWLEARRRDLQAKIGGDLPRPVPPEAPEDTTPPEVKQLRAALLQGLPEDKGIWTEENRARALMAELLEYHRRDAKPAWWRHFHLKGLNDEELREERDAISGLEFEEDIGPIAKSRLFRYRFPPQEHGFSADKQGVDPLTGQPWKLVEVNDAEGWLDIKRGPTKLKDPHPSALIAPGPLQTATHRTSIQTLAQGVSGAGDSDWPREPAFDLLLRRRPNVDSDDGPLIRDDEDGLAAARRLALELHHSCLAIQGPPGTGKTYTGANQIVDLVAAGKRVGVTAMSHAVICNLLDEVAKVAGERGGNIRIGQRPDKDEMWVCDAAKEADLLFGGTRAVIDALAEGVVDVVGGTTWVWTAASAEGILDVLVVDEAGQMSLADVLAASRSARNLILLGDPLQLSHPSQGWHPPIVPRSALDHVLDGKATMPDDLGLFIPVTRRMHPAITRFTSEVFYDGRLEGIQGLEQQVVLCDGAFAGSGLRVLDVAHKGNANASPEEAEVVASLIGQTLGCRWRDREAAEAEIGIEDVMVVTPFNAQIREIREVLERMGLGGVQVGTVDKFQGRQAPLVIYSMASSSAEEAPRGMEFLYDLHRLNVATSRAQCLAIVVGSPDLTRVLCKTPRQMELVNALCRLREFESHDEGRIR